MPVHSFWFRVRLIGADHQLFFPTSACHICSDFRVLHVREGSPSVEATPLGWSGGRGQSSEYWPFACTWAAATFREHCRDEPFTATRWSDLVSTSFLYKYSLRSVGGESKSLASGCRGLFSFWESPLRRESETQGLETRSSHCVKQAQLSRFDFETWVSCLCWAETWTSCYWLSCLVSDDWDMQTFSMPCLVVEMRLSCLWKEA